LYPHFQVVAEDQVRHLLAQEQEQTDFIQTLQADFMQHEKQLRQVLIN
jgi:DNA-dependent RNA polymerase auxiliary subunit epsilon